MVNAAAVVSAYLAATTTVTSGERNSLSKPTMTNMPVLSVGDILPSVTMPEVSTNATAMPKTFSTSQIVQRAVNISSHVSAAGPDHSHMCAKLCAAVSIPSALKKNASMTLGNPGLDCRVIHCGFYEVHKHKSKLVALEATIDDIKDKMNATETKIKRSIGGLSKRWDWRDLSRLQALTRTVDMLNDRVDRLQAMGKHQLDLDMAMIQLMTATHRMEKLMEKFRTTTEVKTHILADEHMSLGESLQEAEHALNRTQQEHDDLARIVSDAIPDESESESEEEEEGEEKEEEVQTMRYRLRGREVSVVQTKTLVTRASTVTATVTITPSAIIENINIYHNENEKENKNKNSDPLITISRCGPGLYCPINPEINKTILFGHGPVVVSTNLLSKPMTTPSSSMPRPTSMPMPTPTMTTTTATTTTAAANNDRLAQAIRAARRTPRPFVAAAEAEGASMPIRRVSGRQLVADNIYTMV